MKDDSPSTYSNKFILSPERSSTLEYGLGPINFNLGTKGSSRSSDAFIPCYKEATLSVAIDEKAN
jgi:hypothetical protein